MKLPVVAFVCTRNSCRSQIAEALARARYRHVFQAVSAGTHPGVAIDPVALRLMRELHGIDMAADQRPKTLDELPDVDVLVTMGCGVVCPFVPHREEEDWGLADPVGQGEDAMVAAIAAIATRLQDLAVRIARQADSK